LGESTDRGLVRLILVSESKVAMSLILTSTVIAAIVAGLVAAWTAQRKIGIENITQDRRSWREKVRTKSLAVHDAIISRDKESINKHRMEFRAILNPEDEDDGAIISCISLPEEGKELERAEEFAERIALLLKHDWERVKLEAGPRVMRVNIVRDRIGKMLYKPSRKKYEHKR
jgi:hypothetical protein